MTDTARQIIEKLIAMHKWHSPEDVAELMESRALVSDLPAIRAGLEPHRSSNETNACDDAIAWIDRQ